jgi:hypothetical protein
LEHVIVVTVVVLVAQVVLDVEVVPLANELQELHELDADALLFLYVREDLQVLVRVLTLLRDCVLQVLVGGLDYD